MRLLDKIMGQAIRGEISDIEFSQLMQDITDRTIFAAITHGKKVMYVDAFKDGEVVIKVSFKVLNGKNIVQRITKTADDLLAKNGGDLNKATQEIKNLIRDEYGDKLK